jgi:hypothetical protein
VNLQQPLLMLTREKVLDLQEMVEEKLLIKKPDEET